MAKKPRRGHKKKPPSKDSKRSAFKRSNATEKRKRTVDPSNIEEGTTTDRSQRGRGKSIAAPRGRGDSGLLLTDPHHARGDLQLVELAVRKGWNVRRKTMIRRRLEDILLKKEAEVVTKDGVISLESAADKMAIDAAKVLVAMDGQDVTRLKAVTGEPKDEGKGTTVNVNVVDNRTTVNNNFDPRTVELARLAKQFGAREFTVEGRAVPIDEVVGDVS